MHQFMSKEMLASKGALSQYFVNRLAWCREEITEMSQNDILQASQEDLNSHFLDKFAVSAPAMQLESSSAQFTEKELSLGELPLDLLNDAANMNDLQSAYSILFYVIPCSGAIHLLRLMPSNLSWHPEQHAFIGESSFGLEVLVIDEDDASIVNSRYTDKLKPIVDLFNAITSEVESFNNELAIQISTAIRSRIEFLDRRNSLLDMLDVPIKLRPGAPPTFRTPLERRTAISERTVPNATVAGSPTPSLADDIYQEIIDLLHFFGKGLERLPNTYVGRREEHIRDYLLLALDSRFGLEGSATAETFNHKGKTDILVRYRGNNVFAAECKFWKGAKSLLATVDQLLSYLTWRDSKAAIVLFVKTGRISNSLTAINNTLQAHGHFLRTIDDSDPTKSVYEFQLSDDRSITAQIAVIVFYFPMSSKIVLAEAQKEWLNHEIERYKLRESEEIQVKASAGSVAVIPDLFPGLQSDPQAIEELEMFHQFALDNDITNRISEVCILNGSSNRVRARFH